MENARVGLLPLYIALYDDCLPSLRQELSAFRDHVEQTLAAQGLEVVSAPIACVRPDFEEALRLFDRRDVDLVVTLHLAYSPSLESADVLAGARQPLLILDTTPDLYFGRDVDPERLLYNHGIHGVQDLAAMLRRRGKDYQVVAGHLSDPGVARRVREAARAARAARRLRGSRVLRIGAPFEGMGDFRVEDSVLRRRLGVHVEEIGLDDLAADVEKVTDAEVAAEVQHDREAFLLDLDPEVHARSVRLGLGLRRRLEAGDFGAFSMSFLAFDRDDGPVSTVPFLECCKAMERGVGYAGEGDVLTAALVGALQSAFGRTTFTEMFCPDWEGGSIFLSHMGEVNPEVAARTPRVYEKPFPFTRARNPAALACAPKPGPATLVNLAPGPEETFRLIAAAGEVLEDGTHPTIHDWVRGWIRPEAPLETFLERYSLLGGTHHCALMLGRHVEGLMAFAQAAGIEGCTIP